MAKQLNTILRLRRDNDYNYAKVADKFIPANGEICLVDTARSGLRAVCGDGKTPFAQLEYADNVYFKGYFKNDTFYFDELFTLPMAVNTKVLYIDLLTNRLYFHTGVKYQEIERGEIATATATDTTPGIMKLYSTTGQNTDGTMTQKAITDELNEKVEIALNIEEELIIFTLDND
jgi:hypothetical protein